MFSRKVQQLPCTSLCTALWHYFDQRIPIVFFVDKSMASCLKQHQRSGASLFSTLTKTDTQLSTACRKKSRQVQKRWEAGPTPPCTSSPVCWPTSKKSRRAEHRQGIQSLNCLVSAFDSGSPAAFVWHSKKTTTNGCQPGSEEGSRPKARLAGGRASLPLLNWSPWCPELGGQFLIFSPRLRLLETIQTSLRSSASIARPSWVSKDATMPCAGVVRIKATEQRLCDRIHPIKEHSQRCPLNV